MPRLLIGLASLAALLLAPPAGHAQQTVKIGLIMTYSGQFADAATQMDNGIKLYMKQKGDTVAGRKLELIRKDTGGIAPEVAKRLAQELVVRDKVDIDMPVRDDLTQQHGYVAAAIVTAIVDTACGYAAMSLMPAGANVLTVEYKVNFMSPARGERLLAHGRVVRPGRALTVCAGEVYALGAAEPKAVAAMLGTMTTVQDAAEVSEGRS